MDQLYLITHTNEILISQRFISLYNDIITSFVINDFMIENELTQNTTENQTQTMISLCIVQILLHAKQNKYNKIMIINTTIHNAHMIDMEHQAKSGSPICIFTVNNINYSYVLSYDIYDDLIFELSYFTSTIDELLMNRTKTERYEGIVSHCIDVANYLIQAPIDLSDNPDPIIDFRKVYLKQHMEAFIQKYTLQNDKIKLMEHMVQKYPYEYLKHNWTPYLKLDIDMYLYICVYLSQYDNFNIRAQPSNKDQYNTIYFDKSFYLKMYPCYCSVFKQPNDAFNHFIHHGVGEKLIPNEAIFELTKTQQQYMLKQLLSTIDERQAHCQAQRQAQCQSNDPIIYILTRTCDRPELFHSCVSSILSQQYPYLRHIVSYDNKSTYKYLQQYTHIYEMIDLTVQKCKIHPNEYIDYFYDLIMKREPGWVLVMDDDDMFMCDQALHYLKQYLINPKALITWMLYRSDKFIYPTNKQSPVVGEIGSCCYMYHTSMIQKHSWGPSGIGDFPCFRRLFARTKEHIYVDLPLTGVNYDNQVSGWSAM